MSNHNNNNSNENAASTISLLRKAMEGHKKYMLDAIQAKGCDRHLFGLYLVAKLCNSNESNNNDDNNNNNNNNKEEIPELFKDVAWDRGRNFRVSTSNMSSQTYVPGFGPVVNDGYGICYG